MPDASPREGRDPLASTTASAGDPFLAILRCASGRIDVVGALLALGAAERVDADPEAARETLDILGARFARRVRGAGGGGHVLTAALQLGSFLEGEGFTSEGCDALDVRGLDLERVLVTRRGLPPALALIHAEVGRRAGLPVHVASWPVRYLVAVAVPPRALVFDPARGGRLVLPEEVPGLCQPDERGRLVPLRAHLEPCPPARLLARWLHAARHVALRSGDAAHAARLQGRIVATRPGDVAARAEWVVLLGRAGRHEEARRELQAAECLAEGAEARALLARAARRLSEAAPS